MAPQLDQLSGMLKAANFAETTVLTQLAVAGTSLVVASGGGAAFPSTYPYLLVLNEQEIVKVTNRSTDTFTIVRAQESTADTQHEVGETVELNWTLLYFNELQNRCSRLERLLRHAWGTADGVIDNASTTMLKVVQQGTPDMTVKCQVGFGFISGEPVEQDTEESTGTITAPSVNDRIDLVQWTLGTGLNVKTGVEDVSPSAPSLDANSISLATILLTTAHIDIDTADITDTRNIL